jgi:ABC-type antimicrobial peptide transport system permease subunit
MGIPLVKGRDFTDRDRPGSSLVAIVNHAFVRRYRLGEAPIGRTVRIGESQGETRYEIVGVVGDAVYTSPRDGMVATMYVPLAQREQSGIFSRPVILTVQTAPGQRAAVERDLAAALVRTDPSVAFTLRTFDQFIRATVTQERLITMLSTFFGGLAVLLAAIGLYGTVAQAVRMRQAEIGLRMALGAQPAGIVRLVLRPVGALLVGGLALGLVVGLWAAQFVGPLLFQIDARDPATFASALTVLVFAGIFAAWLPARRAAALDPATVLRQG